MYLSWSVYLVFHPCLYTRVLQTYEHCSPKLPLPLRCPFTTLLRPSRIETRNYDNVFMCIFRITSDIQTFRKLFADLSWPFATAAKTHVQICRSHSDTESLVWVLKQLPWCAVMYRMFYIYVYCPAFDVSIRPSAKENCVSVWHAIKQSCTIIGFYRFCDRLCRQHTLAGL